MMKLNIGCGNKVVDGYVGVDKFECAGAEHICDIENERLPFPDGSVSAILLDNVIEHFYNIPKVITELVRVAEHGAIIKIITPHFSSLASWVDPTHIHHLSYFSFEHFEREGVMHYIGGKNIKIKYRKLSFGGEILGLIGRLLFKINPKSYEKKYCFMFRASTLTVELLVIKK